MIEMAGERRFSDHIYITKFWGESQDAKQRFCPKIG
jgi:hypothetical protein